MSSTRPLPAVAVVIALAALGLPDVGCAPQPRNVPCSNDGVCAAANPAFRYCLESRCVECVGSSHCGANGTCVDGTCKIQCKDERSCPGHRACNDGVCERDD